MNPKTTRILARRYMKLAHDDDVVAWAVEMLYEGYDTESLRILAGLTFPFSWQDVELYLSRALKELGWIYPASEECLREYAHNVVADILSGAISTEVGSHEMYYITVALDYPKDLADWFIIDDRLDPELSHELE